MEKNKYKNILNEIINKKEEPVKKKAGSSNVVLHKIKDTNKIATLNGKKITLSFPYSIETVMQIKQIDGRKYDPKTKSWSIKSSLTAYRKLENIGFTFDIHAQKEYNKLLNKISENNFDENKFDMSKIKSPKGLELRNYQKNTISFIEQNNGKAIISLEQGLGKTICVSTYIYNHPEIKPIVIVVPATLKYNWKNELEKWAPKRSIEILEGKSAKKLKKTTDIIIINYDILNDWNKRIKEINPQLVVFDECQYIKSVKGVVRSKAAKSLAKKCKYILPLSGTPIINKATDIWNIVNMVTPDMFGSFYEFGQRYGDPTYNGFGWQYNGLSNAEELNKLLSHIMIRYKKSDVLKELPDKIYSYIPIDISNRNEYNEAENNFINYIRSTKGNIAARKAAYAETLTQISTLRQLAADGAIDNAIKYIKNRLENSDEKLVIFANHKTIINKLEETFKDICVKIDGSTKQGEYRQQLVDKFQTDDNIKVFIGNIQAAGVGLTLTASSTVIFLQLPWSKAATEQAVDRTHRIGQKNTVNVIYLLPNNTIEYRLSKIIDSKANISSVVLDDEVLEEQNMISALMEDYENV